MDVNVINHFVGSATKVFDTMLSCQIRRTSLSLKTNNAAPHEVSAIIGLTGKISASIVLSMSESLALKAAGAMMFTEYSKVDFEVSDAIGELANMIVGGAKMRMADMNLNLSLGLPNVLVGVKSIFFPSGVKPLSIGFDSAWGPMALEVGFDQNMDGDVAALSKETQAVG